MRFYKNGRRQVITGKLKHLFSYFLCRSLAEWYLRHKGFIIWKHKNILEILFKELPYTFLKLETYGDNREDPCESLV